MQLWWNVYDKNRLCKHTNQFHKQPCDLPTFKSFFPFFFQLVTDTFEQKRQTILISLVCLLFFLFTTHFEAKNCRGWKCTRHKRCENQLLPVPKIVQEKLRPTTKLGLSSLSASSVVFLSISSRLTMQFVMFILLERTLKKERCNEISNEECEDITDIKQPSSLSTAVHSSLYLSQAKRLHTSYISWHSHSITLSRLLKEPAICEKKGLRRTY